MGMSAKHALAFSDAGIMDSSARDFVGEQQPASVHAVQEAGDTFGSRIYFLNLQKDQLAQPTNPQILVDEAVELMAVHRQMSLALILPNVALVYGNADEVRHQVCEAGVMVSLDPYHLDLALWIGKFADIGKELPVLAGQAAKVEIGKNIAQQNQPSIAVRLQNVERVLCPTHFGPEVDVRQDYSVVRRPIHALVMQHMSREHDEPAMNNR